MVCTVLKTRQIGIRSVKKMCIPCINIVYRWICLKNFLIFVNEDHNESIYLHETGRISNCWNRLLLEVPSCAPAIILTIFFVRWKSSVWRVTPKFYSIFNNRIKVCIIKWSESVHVTDVDHRLNGITSPLSLGIICSIWFFQFMWLSICKPRNFVFPLSSIYSPL